MTAPPETEAFRLLDLPQELRDDIYTLALAARSDAPYITSPLGAVVYLPNPALTAACRFIRHESLRILHRTQEKFWQSHTIAVGIVRMQKVPEIGDITTLLTLCKPLAHQPVRRMLLTFPRPRHRIMNSIDFTVRISVDGQGRLDVFAAHASSGVDVVATRNWTSYLENAAAKKSLSYIASDLSDCLNVKDLCQAIGEEFAPFTKAYRESEAFKH